MLTLLTRKQQTWCGCLQTNDGVEHAIICTLTQGTLLDPNGQQHQMPNDPELLECGCRCIEKSLIESLDSNSVRQRHAHVLL